MSSKFKTSKYKHTTATTQKKELWYPDIKPAPSSDYTSIAASARYIAVAWAKLKKKKDLSKSTKSIKTFLFFFDLVLELLLYLI